MKFAEKCPKCGGFVQTKSIRKSIGLGFVEIPVAQFCLNPVCEWYQDFAETKNPGEIKEGIQFSKNQMIAIAAISGLVILYILFSFIPAYFTGSGDLTEGQRTQPGLQNNTTSVTPDVPKVPPTVPLTSPSQVFPAALAQNHTVKIDASHGFYPDNITINRSDTITWISEENLRPRIVLLSKEGLFEKQLMHYTGRFQFQFDRQGKYMFLLAEYPSYKEYPVATGSVTVR